MLKIDREKQSFALLDKPTLADASITERYDLQEFICNSPDAFFEEIGQELFLLGKEVVPSQRIQDRIDLLAVDREGHSVVIELKRGNHKLQMFQAISYAGMIAQWNSDDFLTLLTEEHQEALSDFLEVDIEDINRQQRIILIAEAYDFALLSGTAWLCEQYGVGIACCRIALAKDLLTNSEYLVCSTVYPAPELAEEAIPRGRTIGSKTQLKWPNWETALSGVVNTAVVSYFNEELAAGRESKLNNRTLLYRLGGKRRWYLHAHLKNAYVWQDGRFEGDLDYWKKGLSSPEDVKPVKRSNCLRLYLISADDFAFFHKAVTVHLMSVQWNIGLADEEMEDSGLT